MAPVVKTGLLDMSVTETATDRLSLEKGRDSQLPAGLAAAARAAVGLGVLTSGRSRSHRGRTGVEGGGQKPALGGCELGRTCAGYKRDADAPLRPLVAAEKTLRT